MTAQRRPLDVLEGIVHHWKWGYLGIEDKVEFLSIAWARPLMLRRHGTVTVITNHELVDVAELGRRIIVEGLRYAGVVEVSRETRHARLIAGNHRLLAFEELGGAYFPIYVAVRDRFERNPREVGIDQSANLSDHVARTVGDVVAAPSEIFLDLAVMKSRGMLPPVRTREDPPVD